MLKTGDVCQFTYRCWESEESQDAVLWHHTDQQVTIIRELNDVDEFDVGKMYRVEFPDGFHGDVFGDELMLTQRRTPMNAVEVFVHKSEDHELLVPQFAITSAIRTLTITGHRIAAIRLIRSAYRGEDGGYASLGEARTILTLICK